MRCSYWRNLIAGILLFNALSVLEDLSTERSSKTPESRSICQFLGGAKWTLLGDITRCLADSVTELDRLAEQMQFLVEKCAFESVEPLSSGLQRAKEKLKRLNEIGRIYSHSAGMRFWQGARRQLCSLVNEGEFWAFEWD